MYIYNTRLRCCTYLQQEIGSLRIRKDNVNSTATATAASGPLKYYPVAVKLCPMKGTSPPMTQISDSKAAGTPSTGTTAAYNGSIRTAIL